MELKNPYATAHNSIIIKGFHSNLIIIAKTQQKIAPYHKKVSIGIGTGYEV